MECLVLLHLNINEPTEKPITEHFAVIKTQIMKISINEPCHENWEAMTPNQQGAFCGSCQKNVVDFSKMSLEGIKNFFKKPQEGRVCGRFEDKQLQELSFDDFFARFRHWNFSRKFATIFVLAFGFWIFSNGAMAQAEKIYMQGDVAIERVEPVKPKTAVEQTKTIKGKIAVKKMVCEEAPKIDKEKPKTVKEEHMRVGMVAYFPEEEKKPEINKIEAIESKPEIKKTEVIDEKKEIKFIEIIRVPQELKVIETSRKVPAEENVVLENKILVYPNPSTGIFMAEAPEKQTLRVYDLTGRLVLSQSLTGLTKVDASHLENGTYTILFTGQKGSITKKLIITR